MVAEYFTAGRAKAYGLATAGVGIGGFTLAPLIDHLEVVYGWRGTLLIFGAILLNMAVCALLMKPKEQEQPEDFSECCYNSEEELRKRLEGMRFLNDEYDVINIEEIPRNRATSLPLAASPPDIPSYLGEDKPRKLGRLSESHGLGSQSHVLGSQSNMRSRRGSLLSRKESLSDIMFSGSIHSLQIVADEHRSNNSLYTSLLKKLTHDGTTVATESQTSESKTPDESEASLCYVQKLYRAMTAYRVLLCDQVFFSLALSNFLTNLSYLMPVLYMVDRAVESGIDKSSATILMSINGVGNLIGRVFFGIMADCACADSVVLYIMTLTLCGLATCVSPLCGGDLMLHGVYAAVFGCFMGELHK